MFPSRLAAEAPSYDIVCGELKVVHTARLVWHAPLKAIEQVVHKAAQT